MLGINQTKRKRVHDLHFKYNTISENALVAGNLEYILIIQDNSSC